MIVVSVDVFTIASLLLLAPIVLVFLASISRRTAPNTALPDRVNEKVAILIPLREEVYESIRATLISIERLNYSKDLIDVYLVVKNDDIETLKAVEKVLSEGWSFRIVIYKSLLEKKLKAADLNVVLRNLPDILNEHQVVGVFDADLLDVDPNQLTIAVLKLRDECVAVSPKIYVFRNSLLGYLTLAESITWYDGVFKGLEALGAIPPLTGKTLYVRSETLRELGGFPEELAEDAFLTLELTERGLKTCYIDSYSFTLSPKDLKSLINQRRRWSRAVAIMSMRSATSSLPIERRIGVAAPYLLSLNLMMFMLISVSSAILASNVLGLLSFIAISIAVFLRLEAFYRSFIRYREGFFKRFLSSLMFTPYIFLQVLIQLVMMFINENSWRKTRRR